MPADGIEPELHVKLEVSHGQIAFDRELRPSIQGNFKLGKLQQLLKEVKYKPQRDYCNWDGNSDVGQRETLSITVQDMQYSGFPLESLTRTFNLGVRVTCVPDAITVHINPEFREGDVASQTRYQYAVSEFSPELFDGKEHCNYQSPFNPADKYSVKCVMTLATIKLGNPDEICEALTDTNRDADGAHCYRSRPGSERDHLE